MPEKFVLMFVGKDQRCSICRGKLKEGELAVFKLPGPESQQALNPAVPYCRIDAEEIASQRFLDVLRDLDKVHAVESVRDFIFPK